MNRFALINSVAICLYALSDCVRLVHELWH
jgi:hypothetical protein